MNNSKNRIGIGVEDVNDVLALIEKKLNFRFGTNELEHVRTFGEFCDVVLAKLNLPEKQDCTSQQAFYKVRLTIMEQMNTYTIEIRPDTALSTLFVGREGRKNALKIEKSLGLEPGIFRIKRRVKISLFLAFMVSASVAFFSIPYAFLSVLLAAVFLTPALKNRWEVNLKSVGELAERMKRDRYFQSRRNQGTLNKREITELLERYFLDNLVTDLRKMDRETLLV